MSELTAIDVLRLYEKWEADLILTDECWNRRETNYQPVIIWPFFDQLKKLQATRGEVLARQLDREDDLAAARKEIERLAGEVERLQRELNQPCVCKATQQYCTPCPQHDLLTCRECNHNV